MAASIFLKDCPECAAANPVDAIRCACGYRFDTKGADTTVDGLELIAQEERLYRDYLAARVKQAAKELEHARAVAKASPGDKVKAAEMLLAEQRYNAARAELEAQQRRAQAVAARAKSARSTAAGRSGRESTRISSPVSAARASAGATATVTPTPAPRPAEPKADSLAAKTNEPPSAKPPTPAPAVPRERAGGGRTATLPAAAMQSKNSTAAAHPRAAAPAHRARVATARAQTAPSPPPSDGAQALLSQSRPAGAVASSSPAAARPASAPSAPPFASPPTKHTVSGSPTASAAFRAQQTARAQAILHAHLENATKECPHCTASVPLETTKCRCGFEFADGQNEIPPLTLCAEERNALLQALGSLGGGPPLGR